MRLRFTTLCLFRGASGRVAYGRGVIASVALALVFTGCTGISARRAKVLELPRQVSPAYQNDFEGDWRFHASIGATGNPSTFLLTGGADHYLKDNLTIGPLLQFGITDDETIVAPTAQVKRFFEIEDSERLRPYVQGGVGFAYIQKDRDSSSRDDVGFLINVGVGVDFWMEDDVTVGTSVLFNILPSEVVDENLFFSWQVLTLRFRF